MGWTHLLSSCPKHSTFRADDLGPYVPRKDQISTAAFHTGQFFCVAKVLQINERNGHIKRMQLLYNQTLI